MLFVLQPLLFCLMISCTKQQPLITGNNPDTTTNQNNNDTTMTDTTDNTDTAAIPAHDSNYSWLALGDSYTIGQSVSEEERFPAQTIALLTNDSLAFPTLQYIADGFIDRVKFINFLTYLALIHLRSKRCNTIVRN